MPRRLIRAGVWTTAACVALVAARGHGTAGAQPTAPAQPVPLERLDLRSLAGEWFEVASWGAAWAHRRCAANTRFRFSVVDARRLGAVRSCTTARGVENRRGLLTAPADGSGAMRGRFVGPQFAWIPAAWAEYWVLASGPDRQWLLVGDHRRERLAVWSKTVALDESGVAAAIAAGRAQGFDAALLKSVAQPAGPSAIVPTR